MTARIDGRRRRPIGSSTGSRARTALSLGLAALATLALGACGARQPTAVPGSTAGAPTLSATSPVLTSAAPEAGAMIDSARIPVGSSPARGRSDALVTIVEFADFQCPFCARVQPTLRALLERYGDDVRLVFKHNPLPFHPDAALAAEAAQEVYAQLGADAFFRYHDALFDGQVGLGRAELERLAEGLGADLDRFRSALDQHAHREAIARDADLAERLSAHGTPAFFVNGSRLLGAVPLGDFVTLVDAVLDRARAIAPREQAYARMVADPVPAAHAAPRREQPPTPDPDAVYNVPVAGAPARGPADALVTVVGFADFQCPFCARAQPTLAALHARYGAALRVVFLHNPLAFHPRAMDAAEAAQEAYAQQGSVGFFRYHDLLFAHRHDPDALSAPALERWARQIGLSIPRFRTALAAHVHQARIQRDAALAHALGAEGTPSFFVNGRLLVGAQPLERFVALAERGLSDAREALARGVPRARIYAALTSQGATAPVFVGDARTAPAAPAYALPVAADAPTRGGPQAPVQIDLFSDFACAACEQARGVIEQLLAQYGPRVRLVWRDHPSPARPESLQAAEGAREALAQQGTTGFWVFHDLLFTNPAALTRVDLERYAAQAGLDVPRFRAALDGHVHRDAIARDAAAADAAGATPDLPVFFVNGRRVAADASFAELARVVDAELARAAR